MERASRAGCCWFMAIGAVVFETALAAVHALDTREPTGPRRDTPDARTWRTYRAGLRHRRRCPQPGADPRDSDKAVFATSATHCPNVDINHPPTVARTMATLHDARRSPKVVTRRSK